MLTRLKIFTVAFLLAACPALAQGPAQDPAQRPVPGPAQNPPVEADDRNGMWTPENVADLRIISQEWWQRFRRTNQRLYKYVGEAAEFRAYLQVCKRHDLNVDMTPINELSSSHLQQILLALFKEAEYGILETLNKDQQAALMTDVAGDAYGFEYGYRIARQTAVIAASGGTTNAYCGQVEETNFKKYIALRATAKRAGEQLQR